MRPVLTAEEMRAVDQAMIEEIGLPGAVLMENAGREVAEVVLQLREEFDFDKVVCVCGPGNNGGDGFVIARYLRAQGLNAMVALLGELESLRGDALLHAEVFQRLSGVVITVTDEEGLQALAAHASEADLLIDALFGTGLSRLVEGMAKSVIEVINASGATVVSVDVPSGLCADTGVVLGAAVVPEVTVTLGAAKLGLVSCPGFSRTGALVVADIGIAESVIVTGAQRAGLFEAGDAVTALPRPCLLDHKGSRGRVAVVGGSPGRRGAPRLSATAALRIGAGLVTLISEATGELEVPDPVMSLAVTDLGGAREALLQTFASMDVVAIGPGLPTHDGARALLVATLSETVVPLVLDADALNLLVDSLDLIAAARVPVVLTPHPGEAARLLNTSVGAIEADRVRAVRELAAKSRAICVLKGARTLVCDGGFDSDFVAVIDAGHPALATAGAGDVLTGAIAGLIAQGVAPLEAARLGAWLHGIAGQELAAARGDRGVIASDLPEAIAAVVHRLSGGGSAAD